MPRIESEDDKRDRRRVALNLAVQTFSVTTPAPDLAPSDCASVILVIAKMYAAYILADE